MLLYLTSLTSGSIKKIDFKGKKKLAFIATAADLYEDKSFVENDRQALISKGLEIHDFDIKGYSQEELLIELSKFEILFFSGGCAHYLLKQFKETGLDKMLGQILDKDIIYVGSSAGSIVLSPDIDYIKPMDTYHTKVALTDTKGAGIVDFYLLPHYGREKYSKVCDEILQNDEINIIPVKDDEVIVVGENDWEKL